MYDLTQFSLKDMTACGVALRQMGDDAASMEEVANKTVRYLYEHLRDASGERACVLVRFFKTHPYNALNSELRHCVQEELGHAPTNLDMKYLTLLATAGLKPAWNDRQLSKTHQAFPLSSPEMIMQFPMLSQLVKQFGLPLDTVVQPDPSLLVDLRRRTFNVFHVPEAVGSPYIPVQDGFVVPFGIQSVLGFGGLCPSGNFFTVILFSKVTISREAADCFKTLALNVKTAVLPFDNGVIFTETNQRRAEFGNSDEKSKDANREIDRLETQVAALNQLLETHETAVLEQSGKIEQVMAELRDQTEQLTAANTALEGEIAENVQLRKQAEETAVIQERNRLARDLHDSVTQALYSQTLYAEAASRQLAGGELTLAADHLHQLKQTAQQALQEMRLLIFELRPSALEDEGLVTALQARLEAVEGRTGVETTFAVDDTIQLSSEIEVGLYWISQEALNNALKYSQAKNISLVLSQDQHTIRLQIKDNGIGFDTDSAQARSHLGLYSMQERAEKLNWRLLINSQPKEGTTVQVEISR